MGLFDGRSYSDGERLRAPSHSGHTSRSRGHSPARSTSHSANVRPTYARSASGSFFGGGSSRGIFSSGGGGSSSSYYKRRPRDGYISYLMHKLQRMVKELWYYARRHPVKAFFAVIVPLVSAGGALHGLLKQFGIRLPMMDGGSKYSRGMGGSFGSSGFGRQSSGGGGWMNNAGSLMSLAKAFM
ncbi:hypothetical protein LTR36_007102 [Oleoguttula mirabilis]|uniref:Uncharacterized protein n=1 Tax=Oleoguttula mirabilis TaxID=1507867 RepID=A0AAV9JB78_9PEZI|nr:hypothetical protein LTR36_007102 [Oleoguttula mirabilis]